MAPSRWGASGWASYGTGSVLGDLARLHGTVRVDDGTTHRSYLRIALGGSQTPVLYSEYGDSLKLRIGKTLAANRGWITMERGATYTLSCYMRANRSGTTAILMAILADPTESRYVRDKPLRRVSLGVSWRRYALTFRAAKPYGYIAVGADSGSRARIDVDVTDVQLEQSIGATPYAPHQPVEIGVEPSVSHGVFVAGQAPALVVRAYNHLRVPANVTIRFSATDFDDREIRLAPVTMALHARSSASRSVALPSAWRGFYRIRYTYRTPAGSNDGRMRLAIVPSVPRGDTVLGVNHAFMDGELIRLARKAGVTWYRDWSLKWQDVEPVKGARNWGTCDTQIGRVLREGANVLPLLPPLPSARWASEAPADMPTDGWQGERRRESWAPRDPSNLIAFVSSAVKRYRSRIRVWEFLNEPIYTGYSLPGVGVGKYPGRRYTPADYVVLLRRAAAAMRTADSGCRVIGGAGSGPEHLTREMLDAGILDAIDVMNLHIYPGLRKPESFVPEMDALLRAMDARGGRKPFWITEFSYYGADDLPRRPFVPEPGDWAEERLLPDERTVAQYTVRFLTLMLARGAEKVFLHSGATGTVNAPLMECCLFAATDGAPRKVFPVLAVLTSLLGPHPRFAGERTLGAGSRAVAFETATRAIVIAWSPDAQGISARFPANTKCTDIVGRSLQRPTQRLSPSPLYVLGARGTATRMLRALITKPHPADSEPIHKEDRP